MKLNWGYILSFIIWHFEELDDKVLKENVAEKLFVQQYFEMLVEKYEIFSL